VWTRLWATAAAAQYTATRARISAVAAARADAARPRKELDLGIVFRASVLVDIAGRRRGAGVSGSPRDRSPRPSTRDGSPSTR
jgi:hypothetical protein